MNRIPELIRELKVLLSHEVSAGFHQELVPGNVLMVATVQEFGAAIPKTRKMQAWLGIMARKHGVKLDKTKGRPGWVVIPARSFVRSTAEERGEAITGVATRMLNRVIEGSATGMDAMTAVGLKMEQEIKAKINRVTEPPLHPLTVAMKGTDKPLVRTGAMRAAVRHRIRRVGEGG